MGDTTAKECILADFVIALKSFCFSLEGCVHAAFQSLPLSLAVVEAIHCYSF